MSFNKIWLFLAVVILGLSVHNIYSESSGFEQAKVFRAAQLLIKDKYVEDRDDEELFKSAMEGMMRSLDTRSRFMTADEIKELRTDTTGILEGGIGASMQIDEKREKLVIMRTIKDGPARKADLRYGDAVVKIDGVAVEIPKAVKESTAKKDAGDKSDKKEDKAVDDPKVKKDRDEKIEKKESGKEPEAKDSETSEKEGDDSEKMDDAERKEKLELYKSRAKALTDLVNKIRGKKGAPLTLTIERKGWDVPRDIQLVREEIYNPSVRGARLIDEKEGVGYLHLYNFQGKSGQEMKTTIEALMKQGMKSLVLDLRENPGGVLTAAIDVANLFIDKGLIVCTQSRDQRNDEVHEASGKAPWAKGLKIAVLINGESASASEILAGALRDHGRAFIVGSRSYGKGSVQSIEDIVKNKYAVCLTIAYYYTPSGFCVDRSKFNEDDSTKEETRKSGLLPDAVVNMDEKTRKQFNEVIKIDDINELPADAPELQTVKNFVDPQLNKALEMLKQDFKVEPRPEKRPERKTPKPELKQAA